MDKDKDGYISTSELKEAMASIGLDPTESQLKSMIDSVDSDGKGQLNFAEFESLVTREVAQSSLSFAKKYFEMYDTDKDGTITVDELYQSLHAAGYSDEHIEDATKELLESADFDKDKKVSFEGKYFHVAMLHVVVSVAMWHVVVRFSCMGLIIFLPLHIKISILGAPLK